jgi:hypothetical protein
VYTLAACCRAPDATREAAKRLSACAGEEETQRNQVKARGLACLQHVRLLERLSVCSPGCHRASCCGACTS